MSVNRVTITGNLTRDPDVRVTTNGTQVMNFGIAVNDRYRNQQTGEWEDRPNFIECVLFGQRVESLSRILRKGFKCAIDGKLRQNTWERDGQRNTRIEIVIDDLDFMQRRAEPGGHQTESRPAPSQSQAYQPAPEYRQDRLVGADDIPF